MLPPEVGPGGKRVSPTCTVMSAGRRPSSSAAMTASAVRMPVPRSWAPWNSSTLPSRCTRTSAATASRTRTYQLPLAMPIPRFLGPGRPPGTVFRRSQPMALAPTS